MSPPVAPCRVLDLARALAGRGVEILSTGGTANTLKDAGIAVKDVAEHTGFPEMMDGRLKTLHPKVHGGLLAIRGNAEHDAATVQDAARAVGVQIRVARAVAESDFENIFAILVRERAGALLINSDVFFTSRRDQIIALAARHALPLISSWREFPVAGALISYGPSISAAYRQIGLYTGKILKGAKPADLPVVQPTAFDLVINLKTANMLGINVPLHLQQLADEVIE